MGAGKSTVGARVARSRGLAFVDLDEELAAAFACPVEDIFARFGEPAFRAMEVRLLRQALSLPNRVVALGGGAVLATASRQALREHATWVHLDVPFPELERRVGGGGRRPLWDSSVQQRFMERAPLYAEAPYRVDGDRRPGDVAEAVNAIADAVHWEVPTVGPRAAHREPVTVPGAAYEVVIGRGMEDDVGAALAAVGTGAVGLLSDWNVVPLHADGLARRIEERGRRVVRQTLPAGEENKQIRPVLDAVGRLLDGGWERGAPVVALGGGVLGDMGGLVASLLLRGVPFVQVPTTLLAMVDASVGGKVGVNHRRGKNLIGSFWQPSLVWTDLAYLDTLPDRELRAGLAEVVKSAMLGDEELFELLEQQPDAFLRRDPDVLADAVLRCVRFKAGIVAEDAREKGIRASLNLGHTVGHAIEAAAPQGTIRHGEAVAIGLVAAAEISTAEGLAPASLPDRVRRVLTGLGLPIAAPPLPRLAIKRAIEGDKKLKDGGVLWILVPKIAQPRLVWSELDSLEARLDLLFQKSVLTKSGDY